MRILLKFGSSILTRPRADALDAKQFERLTTDMAQLKLQHGEGRCLAISDPVTGSNGPYWPAPTASPACRLRHLD